MVGVASMATRAPVVEARLIPETRPLAVNLSLVNAGMYVSFNMWSFHTEGAGGQKDKRIPILTLE